MAEDNTDLKAEVTHHASDYVPFKGILYEGRDLTMKDLVQKAQWKIDLIKDQTP